VLSAIFVVVFNYRDLPQRIPTHFGITAWLTAGEASLALGLGRGHMLPLRSVIAGAIFAAQTDECALPRSIALRRSNFAGDGRMGQAEITCMLAYIVWSAGRRRSAGHSQGLGVWFSPSRWSQSWNVAVLYPADEKAGEIGRGHHRLKKSPGWIEPVGQGDEVAAVLQFPARFSRQ